MYKGNTHIQMDNVCGKFDMNCTHPKAAQSLVARRNSEQKAKRMGSREKVVQLLGAVYHEIRCVAPV